MFRYQRSIFDWEEGGKSTFLSIIGRNCRIRTVRSFRRSFEDVAIVVVLSLWPRNLGLFGSFLQVCAREKTLLQKGKIK